MLLTQRLSFCLFLYTQTLLSPWQFVQFWVCVLLDYYVGVTFPCVPVRFVEVRGTARAWILFCRIVNQACIHKETIKWNLKTKIRKLPKYTWHNDCNIFIFLIITHRILALFFSIPTVRSHHRLFINDDRFAGWSNFPVGHNNGRKNFLLSWTPALWNAVIGYYFMIYRISTFYCCISVLWITSQNRRG